MKRAPFDFWSFVDRLRKVTPSHDDEAAENFFKKAKTEDVAAFRVELDRRLEESFRWDLWAVGAITSGHVKVDFLSGFQTWLILQGREFYESVLKDPAKAAERIPATDPSTSFPYTDLDHAARLAILDRTDKDPGPSKTRRGREPAGTPWTWRDLPRLRPALWEEYFVKRDRRPIRPESQEHEGL